ncbi:thymidylate synthase [Methylophaga sp.]|uniref:thymidylate synthase n=1 Tax=Methylophaga sp. TaxID=2024840 RepID=UPI003A91D21E
MLTVYDNNSDVYELMKYFKFLKHIYEDQLELMRDVQLKREPYPSPSLHINPEIRSLKDLETWVTLDDFEVKDYRYHEAIKYPFSV